MHNSLAVKEYLVKAKRPASQDLEGPGCHTLYLCIGTYIRKCLLFIMPHLTANARASTMHDARSIYVSTCALLLWYELYDRVNPKK